MNTALKAVVAAATALGSGAALAAETNFGNTAVTLGGYIKFDVLASRFSDARVGQGLGRDFYFPSQIPITADADEDAYTALDFSAKESRLWFKTVTDFDGYKLGSYAEIDFISSQINPAINTAGTANPPNATPTGAGNESSTNAYNVALRRAFITLNGFLIGQEWSNFLNLGALPDTIDFIYMPTEGGVVVRQPQARYTVGKFSVSLENPQTTTTLSTIARTDDNTLPDLTAQYQIKVGKADLALAGLLRQLRIDQSGYSDTAVGGGISFSGKIPTFGKDDLRFMVTGGDGIGRYTALGLAADTAFNPTVDDKLDPIRVYNGYLAYRHPWSEQWRSTLTVGYFHDKPDRDLTGDSYTREVKSASINLLYSPVPKLTVGAEYRHSQRENYDDLDGTLDRLQFSAKYTF